MLATEKLVEFTRGQLSLRGMLHLPDGRGARKGAKATQGAPAVLILHGFTGNRIGGGFLPVKLSRALAGAGIASLRFDFAGSGESEGRFVDMTPLTELDDARAALGYLAGRRGIDRKRLGVYGHSLGGFVAGMLLEEGGGDAKVAKVAKVKSAALLAAPAELTRLIDMYSTPEAERELDESGHVLYGLHRVGRRFFEDAKRADPLAAVASSRADVLVVHGDADETVPLEHARMFEDAAASRDGPRTEVLVIPEMGHAPETPAHEETFVRRTVGWFGETLA